MADQAIAFVFCLGYDKLIWLLMEHVMNKFLLGLAASMALCTPAMAEYQADQLVGQWSCKVDHTDELITAKVRSVLDFRADGTSRLNEVGQLHLFGVGGAYHSILTEAWQIEEDHLVTKVTDVIKLDTAEDLAPIMNREIIEANPPTRLQITELDAQTLKLLEPEMAIEYDCTRKSS